MGETCQKLSPLRACSGSFAARLVVRLCGYGFTMHPGCSVSCTGVDRFGWLRTGMGFTDTPWRMTKRPWRSRRVRPRDCKPA